MTYRCLWHHHHHRCNGHMLRRSQEGSSDHCTSEHIAEQSGNHSTALLLMASVLCEFSIYQVIQPIYNTAPIIKLHCTNLGPTATQWPQQKVIQLPPYPFHTGQGYPTTSSSEIYLKGNATTHIQDFISCVKREPGPTFKGVPGTLSSLETAMGGLQLIIWKKQT